MSTKEKDCRLAKVLPVIRGLLAAPLDNEDDPYSRVLFGNTAKAPAGRAGVLDLGKINPDMPVDGLRTKIRGLLDKYSKKNGCLPGLVSMPGWVAAVEKERIAAEYPLRNKVAVVTGAAGAIGAGICRGLLEKGCRVAATDLVPARLNELVEDLNVIGRGRIIGVPVDVTKKESLERGFGEVIRTWGGVDIVVVNAGIAMVAPLMDMDPDAFRRLEKVNVEGTLLTMAEAGRNLVRQGIGGDIVLVSSKNVFAPGAQFGAYSATKAASHQLARIASLEYAPYGIRVNMVSPDAVFSDGKRRSGLWAEIGPSRMKARGLDEKGLEEYYRNRNLLKARVTANHVANAVLFFVTRQTPTTGATIPVDGGIPEAAPR